MIRYLTPFVLALMSTAAYADDIKATSHIESVTVFPDKAVITRTVNVAIAEGDHTVVVPDLPIGLDPSSIRVEATGAVGLMIGSVDIHAAPPQAPTALADSDSDKIRALRSEHVELDDVIVANEAKRRLIERLSVSATDGFLTSVSEGRSSTDQMREMWIASTDELSSTLSAIRAARTRQQAIDDEIARIRSAGLSTGAPKSYNEARVALTSRNAGNVTLKLAYRTNKATWRPVYDARLLLDHDTEKPSVQLALRASVSQSTGEDWRDVDLTLSTARPSLGTAAPHLRPSVIHIQSVLPPPTTMITPYEQTLQAFAPAMSPTNGKSADASEIPVAEERTADARTNGLTAVFHVPGRITVENGVGQRNLKISSSNLDARLSIIATPKQTAAAYLTATFHHDGNVPLLPGDVSIYRDSEFVGTGQVPFTSVGDDIKLGFGVDDKIKIDRVPLKQSEDDNAMFGYTHQETHDFKIVVKNLHDQPMPVTIEDQIPVSEAGQIVVEALPTTTAPTQVNADDRRGVLQWSFDMKPNEGKDILIGWLVKYANGQKVFETTADH